MSTTGEMSTQTWEYIANFLSRDEADELLAVLRAQQPIEAGDKTRVSYGPQIFPIDKKNSDGQWFTESQNQKPEPPLLTTLRACLTDKYRVPFNSIQCNFHEGTSEVEEHLDPHGTICMLRVGAPREFIVAPYENRSQKTSIVLEHGSLLTFLKSTHHCMKPNPTVGSCVSVIFRLVTEPLTQSSHDNPKRFVDGAKAYDRIVKEFRTKPSQQSLIFVQQSAGTLATVEESITLGEPAGVQRTRTGLTFSQTVTIDEWIDFGRKLKQVEGAIQWWIGDWLRYGEKTYGEKYAEALEATEYEEGSLRTIKWVSGAVGVSLRRDNLSWSHHKEVAALEPGEQAKLLDWAEKENVSVKELRAEIKQTPQPAPIQDWDLPTLLEELTNYKINKIEGDEYAALAEITIKKLKTGRADGVNDTIETLRHAAKIVMGLADTLRTESTEKPTDIFGDK